MMYTPSSPEASDVEEVMEEEFESLPRSLKRKIDQAFDRAVREVGKSGGEKKKSKGKGKEKEKKTQKGATGSGGKEIDEGGGFLPPEDDDMGGGGFIPMDTDDGGGGFMPVDKESSDGEDSAEFPTHIPLSLVPRALQILDLPQDIDVLTIFENAASGWSGQKVGEEDAVSRKDWRAVCAVLFEDPRDTGVKDDSLSPAPSSDAEQADEKESVDGLDDDEDDEDAYAQSDGSEEEDADSDYGANGSTKHSKRTTRSKGKAKATSPNDDEPSSGFITLTSRQKKESKAAFALFFPDVPEKELAGKRLKIKEVADAAKTLKERMTAEEIVEMLEYFSTSPDKSLSLSDFEQMCMRTGLV